MESKFLNEVDLKMEFGPSVIIIDEKTGKIKKVGYSEKNESIKFVKNNKLWTNAPVKGRFNRAAELLMIQMGIQNAPQEDWDIFIQYIWLKIYAGINKLDWLTMINDPRNDIKDLYLNLFDKYIYSKGNTLKYLNGNEIEI